MNKVLPPIQESAAELKQLMRRESHSQKQQRLQALYLLQSGQARTRSAVAALLGVHRNTVGEWLSNYEAGGLAALLMIATPPGREPTLNERQLAQLEAALARPEGFSSYGAVQDWIAKELGVEMPYKTVHHVVRYRLGASLKQPRRSHVKKNLLSK